MKKFFAFLAVCLMVSPVMAVSAPRGRALVAGQMASSGRATVSTNQISAMAALNGKSTTGNANLAVTPQVMEPAVKDMREKEKSACIGNNIGIGNTFVWASRYSNLNNYASMIEDVEEPANNTCFVKVGLKSDDTRINVSDVPAKYFEMGQTITCGSWANEEDMRQRILDAKKGARIGGTIAASVGGAAIGVGVMELFVNEKIGGKVEGQAALKDAELWRSQILTLQKDDASQYKEVIKQLSIVKVECEGTLKNSTDTQVKEICEKYSPLFDLVG